MSERFAAYLGGRLLQAGIGAVPGLVERRDVDLLVSCSRTGGRVAPLIDEDQVGRVLRRPFDDSSELPGDEILHEVPRAVAEALHGGEVVLVHCGAGVNRSGFVCALALRLHLGVEGDQAVRLVRGMADHRVLRNQVFRQYVERLPAPGTAPPE